MLLQVVNSSGIQSCDPARRLTIRDLGSNLLTEFRLPTSGGGGSDASPALAVPAPGTAISVRDYVYRGSLLLGEGPAVATTSPHHFHLDHLGTPRLITDAGAAIVETHQYFPFGEEATPDFSDERLRFTGHERDTLENGGGADDIDYMHARYYVPLLSRFSSPDTLWGSTSAPQSWNRYSYAEGNPVVLTDADGNDPNYQSKQIAEAVVALSTIPEVAGTLALYTGDRQLRIIEGNPGSDPYTGDKLGGDFSATPDENTLDYGENIPKMEAIAKAGGNPFDEEYSFATAISFKNDATITLGPGWNLWTLLHEFGHADQAARNPLQYFKDTRPAVAKKFKDRSKRPAEQYAIEYVKRNKDKLSPVLRFKWHLREFNHVDPSHSTYTFP